MLGSKEEGQGSLKHSARDTSKRIPKTKTFVPASAGLGPACCHETDTVSPD